LGGAPPSDAPVFSLAAPANILDLLYESGLVASKGEARRLVQQGGVRVDGATIQAIDHSVTPVAGGEVVIQAGKRKFLRVLPAQPLL